MNEEQRKAGTIDILNERNKKQKKTIVNISNMFINHLIFKEAKSVVNKMFNITEIFILKINIKVWGKDEHFN